MVRNVIVVTMTRNTHVYHKHNLQLKSINHLQCSCLLITLNNYQYFIQVFARIEL